MLQRSALLATLFFGCLYSLPGLSQSTYELTRKGATCKTSPNGMRYCTYVVGTLEFAIQGIGSNDTKVHFLKSDIADDYYAQVYVQEGCVVVLAGAKTNGSAIDRAYVAIGTGKVVRSSGECKDDAK